MSDPLAAPDAALLTAPPSLSLEGKVAWITGATRGLGRTAACAFAGAGAAVVLTGRRGDQLEALADAIRASGAAAEAVAGSVEDAGDVARTAERIGARFGRLDVLVNNAGISPMFQPAEAVDLEAFSGVLETNLTGAVRCCQAAFPLLREAGGASIVNVSSVHGTVAHERLLAYAASKGGIELVTRTLALDWAPHGIRVNAVAPGYAGTDMTASLLEHERWREHLLQRIPLRRFAEPPEIAAAMLFLASPASSYVTGTTLFVDGGWTAQ